VNRWSMRNISTIVHKHGFSTDDTCNKLRDIDSCLDFNTNTTIFYDGDGEQWIMWDEICTLLKGGELGAQIICLWEM
jgi:hypothetical protein